MKRRLLALIVLLTPLVAAGQASTLANGACRLDGVDCGALPSQATHSGKYLTTNGTTASWGTVNTLPSQTGNADRPLVTNGTSASWSTSLKIAATSVYPITDNAVALGSAGFRFTQASIAGAVHFGTATVLGATTGVDVGYGEAGTLYIGKPKPNTATVDNTGGAVKAGNVTAAALPGPTSLTITQIFSTGSTTVTYAVVSKMADGTYSAPTYGTTTTSMDTLSEGTFEGNRITWAQVPGAVSYDIYRTVSPTDPASTGKLANIAWSIGTAQYDDYGYAGDGNPPPTLATAGTVTATRLVTANVVANTGTITALPGLMFTNEGDADGSTVTLPSAVAGLTVTVYVQTGQTITVTAGTGDTIRISSNVTAAAGSITSNVVGSSVTLTAINATEWVATSAVGTWSF